MPKRTAKTDDPQRPPTSSSITCRPLQPDDWDAITQLFGANGACGGCWCMWWRVPQGGRLWEQRKGDRNREAFRRLIRSGRVFGVLGFAGDEPIGWCCVGPKPDFPRMQSIRALRGPVEPATWSVTCFYIRPAWRRNGLGSQMLRAAVDLAFRNGAGRVEGYPVVPRKSAEPIPAAFAWTGVPRMFETAGFQRLPTDPATRPTYFIERRPRRG